MKKSLFVFLLCLFNNNVKAQNILVRYVLNESYQWRLIITDTASHWSGKPLDTKEPTEYQKSDGSFVVTDPKVFLLKHYADNAIYFRDFRFYKREFYVKDSLHQMKWKKLKEKKEILGYNCKSATTTFRGRTYKAFYTEQIPISEGPFKFGGLPGLILEIYSLDDEYKWVAFEYSNKSDEKPRVTPKLKDYEFISWDKYVEEYKATALRAWEKNKAEAKPGESGSLMIQQIEIFFPEFQTGKGLRW